MSNIVQASAGITGHAVVLLAPVGGHWPVPIVLAVKLVQQRPGTVVTMLVAGDFLKKASDALDQYFAGEEVELRKNIRVVKIGGDGLVFEELLPLVFQKFGQYFTSLVSSSDIVCKSGKTYPGIRPPDFAVIDLFFLEIIDIIRTTSPVKIPVYGLLLMNTACILRFRSKEIGGYGDVAVEAPILAKQLNKSVEEASYDMYYPTKGEVISVPGLPTMYDYEFDTERPPLSFAGPVIQLKNSAHQFLRQCDGVLTATDDVLEPEGNDAFRAWFAETNRSVYALGPLEPKEYETSVTEVSDFLSRMHKIYGDHSVLYVSTGSHFSPQGPGFAKIMEILLDMRIPLIYSSASRAKLPADLVERFTQSDKVFTSSWIPQRTVLNHPATGCFLTHGGQNSYSEAISAGVPLIAYPITGDQPMNAAYISLKHNIGYELLEIRTEYALRPAYRGGHPTGTLDAIEREIRDVTAKAFGPDGEEKRRNIRLLRDRRRALWGDGGASKEAFLRFIRENLP